MNPWWVAMSGQEIVIHTALVMGIVVGVPGFIIWLAHGVEFTVTSKTTRIERIDALSVALEGKQE